MSRTRKADRAPYVPIDQRDPKTVRAVILARKSGSGSAKIVGGVDADVQSQVEECQALIARTGWTLVADPYAYTEKHKSGYYRVERPVLDAVLQLAQRGEVDVIVAREMERVSRTKAGRYQAIGTAAKYGAEFRFANLPPNGKLPKTTEGKLYLAVLEEFGEMERDRIVERTAPGVSADSPQESPAADGLARPTATVGQTRTARRRTTPLSRSQRRAPSCANSMRASPTGTPAHASLHASWTREACQRPVGAGSGPPARSSASSATQSTADAGRTKRWETVRTTAVNSETRDVHDYATSRDRTRRDTYVEETYPIDPKRAPALVTPEVWDRAQAVINEKKNFYGKLGRWNSPHPVEATLLHGGYVRCARCGSPMVRQWAKSSTARAIAACNAATTPTTPAPCTTSRRRLWMT